MSTAAPLLKNSGQRLKFELRILSIWQKGGLISESFSLWFKSSKRNRCSNLLKNSDEYSYSYGVKLAKCQKVISILPVKFMFSKEATKLVKNFEFFYGIIKFRYCETATIFKKIFLLDLMMFAQSIFVAFPHYPHFNVKGKLGDFVKICDLLRKLELFYLYERCVYSWYFVTIIVLTYCEKKCVRNNNT